MRSFLLIFSFLSGLTIQSYAQAVTGFISDAETNERLPGVNIRIKGTTSGTTTSSEGSYKLNLNSAQDTLIFSFIGYQTRNVPVNGRSTINVKLQTKVYSSEELVVVGYGTQKKENITGSVSTVDIAEAKSGQPITNVSNALHGAPGVYVSLRNSMPGQDRSTIRIRGLGTLNNSSPLVLVDGVEYPMDELNPDDIKDITVLKDASAAIYGSRAANGVILVTTKEGGLNSKVTYSSYAGIQRPTFMPDAIWDPIEYMNLKNQAVLNGGQTTPEYSQEEIEEYQNGLGTDPIVYPANNWFDIALNDGFVQKHDLSFSGGTSKYNYRLSLGYLDRNGIVTGSNNDEDKYSIGLNTSTHLNDNLEIGLNLNGYYRNYTRPVYGNGGFWTGLMRTLPIMPDTVATGEYAYTWLRTSGRNNWENPRMLAEPGTYRKNVQRFLANVYANYTMPFNLEYDIKFGADKYDGFQEQFVPQMYKIQTKTGERYNWNSPSTAPRSYNNDWNDLKIHFYNTLSWQQTFVKKHEVDLMIGASYDNFDSANFDAAMTGYFNETHPVPALNAGTIRYSTGGYTTRDVLMSYFGRANYVYNEKYILNATFRYDGSSRFAEDNRWGFFPSVSAAWRIDAEPFFTSELINTFKLRASVGELGNQAVSLYSYESSIQVGEDYNFGGELASGAAVRSYVDPDITWETTRTYNVGVDLSMLEDRISATADVYKKSTTDILRTVNIPSQVGDLAGPKQNVGTVDNTGYELTLGYSDSKEDFFYSIQGNVNYNKNEVIDLDGQILYGDGTNLPTITQEGNIMNAYYLLETNGIFQSQEEVDNHAFQDNNTAPGYIRYKDQNGDGVINGDDRVIFDTSSRTPKYTFGFNINLGYKGVSLNTQWQGITGLKTYPAYNLAFPFNNGANATREWITDSWTPERTDASLPIITESTGKQGNFRDSDFWLRDGSYLRLKNIQLGYTLPQKWLERLQVSKLTVYVNAQNWITFSKQDDFDPEMLTNVSTPYHYPMLKTLTGGVNITF